jgi:hypothetical protein
VAEALRPRHFAAQSIGSTSVQALEEARVVKSNQRKLLAVEHEAANRRHFLLDVAVDLDVAGLLAQVGRTGDDAALRVHAPHGDREQLKVGVEARQSLDLVGSLVVARDHLRATNAERPWHGAQLGELAAGVET